ncbi:uncharacterized protein [Argopecten irradians]|uniref:uncharacterized protein n=1 Tax=Argopecten irradians TaxID=31199 RepID=UPI003717E9FB
MDPQPVNNMHFGKRSDCDKQRVLNFDPRHSSDRIYDQDHYTNMMMELKAVFPKSGMSHLAIIPDFTPPVQREEVVLTAIESDPMEERAHELVYKPNSSTVHLLAPIDPSLSQYIEEKTRGQRESVLWQDLHKGRITWIWFRKVQHFTQTDSVGNRP